MAIQGFASTSVERFYVEGRIARGIGWRNVARIVRRKLDMLDDAVVLADRASRPGNRLEPLKGKLAGFHSIRINDQWRVVLRWTASGPAAVDIRDDH